MRFEERRPDTDHRDECGDAEREQDRFLSRPRLQLAFGLHHQPAGADKTVPDDQARAGHQRKRRRPFQAAAGELAAGNGQALDVGPEYQTLRESCHHRTEVEGAIPQLAPARQVPKFERHTAEDKPDQHDQDRKVHRRNDDRERERKCGIERDTPEYQPRLVTVPDRGHRIHHQIAARLVRRKGGQDAHAEVEAVEQNVHEHRQRQNAGPKRDEIKAHRVLWWATSRLLPPIADAPVFQCDVAHRDAVRSDPHAGSAP